MQNSNARVLESPSVDELVGRLAAHRTLGGAPRVELEWLARHGSLARYAAGEAVATPAAPIVGMFIVLSGRLSLHVARGGSRHKIAEWRAGDVTGVLPYSRVVAPPGDTLIEETTELFVVPREALGDMVRECQDLTTILVHVMLDRARLFTSTLLHDEKLKSLGKLAAGLAHELNNPAAAITRFAKMLPAAVDAAEAASEALAGAGLDAAEMDAVRRMGTACRWTPVRQVRSPIEEAEHEDRIASWLEERGVDSAAAEAVAQSPVTMDAIEQLGRTLRPGVLGPALRWVAADSTARHLASEIDLAGTRISDLVTSVRGFTRVDASTVRQPVDVAEGLSQTLAVLAGAARQKSVKITVEAEDGLPKVPGVAAELNQVWANLIDNAVDAVPTGGTVRVTASRERNSVAVRVADNGPGIPAEVRERIFDPFFTTKDVGEGMGLGLDVVRRLVLQHDGDITVTSEPGWTEFTVTLPVAGEPGGPHS
jgi:signal transduction histidine kinase